MQTLNSILFELTTVETFIALTDELVLSGNAATALWATLLIAPSLFCLILNKELQVDFDLMMCHLQLWKEAMERRGLDSQLLLCLVLWLPFLYQGQKISRKTYD